MRIAGLLLGWALLVAALVLGVGLKVAHPDMTDMRLWLSFPLQLAGATLLVLGGGALVLLCGKE